MPLNINSMRVWTMITMVLCCSTMNAQRPVPAAYSNPQVNSIRTWEAASPQTDPNLMMTKPLSEVRQSVQYFDGLGRPIQTVIKQGSLPTGGTAADLVTAVEYDQFGREPFNYLPFRATSADGSFKSNPFIQQAAFYANASPALNPIAGQGETFFYGETKFEASPLNRVVESYAPGNSWAGSSSQSNEANRRAIKHKYFFNTSVDAVRIWKVTNGSPGTFGSYSSTSAYDQGQLFKNITQDEHNNQVIEFKDKEGKVVLKKVQNTAANDNGGGSSHAGWLNTYYIYDDLNNLRAVIQPAAVEQLASASWTLTASMLLEQCFRYEYDHRNRMIIKKVPGAGAVNMVYDARDRLVMTRDANMDSTGHWLITKYDMLNRPVETGTWANSATAESHRSSAAASTNYPQPTTGYTLLTKTGYDNYTGFPSGTGLTPTFDNSFSNSTYIYTSYNNSPLFAQPLAASLQTVNMVTWTQTAILGSSGAFLYTVNFYDDKGRLIQVKSKNLSGGTDITSTQYNWSGQPLVLIQKQQKAGTNPQTIETVLRYHYDDLGRMMSTERKLRHSQVNSNTFSAYKTLVDVEYDALGQVKTKKLSPDYDGGAGLETLNFDYNIRGWLLGINRQFIKNNADRKFGFELAYDKAANILGGTNNYTNLQYNGNIAGTTWKSAGDDERRRYLFTYDGVNRLKTAAFAQYSSDVFNLTAGLNFSVSNLQYDANGNITRMNQFGWKGTGSECIDSLRYNYFSGSNRLMNVYDFRQDSATRLGDFRYSKYHTQSKSHNSTVDYHYDANGNMVTDRNKDIGRGAASLRGVRYNYLNLPEEITVYAGATQKGKIIYTYDAAGNKLQKRVTETGKPDKVTLYLGGMVFQQDTLQFLGHAEGRTRFVAVQGASPSKFEDDYFIKDHLGNVRMVLTEEIQAQTYPELNFEGTAGQSAVQLQDGYWENKTGGSINVAASRISRPANFGTSSTNGSFVMSIKKSQGAIGAAKLLKVMSGDRIHTKIDYFYTAANTNNSGANGLSSLLANLAMALSGSAQAGAVIKEASGSLSNALSTNTGLASLLNTPNNSSGSNQAPKAYLNILFFDEQFKFDEASSGIFPVAYSPNSKQTISRIASDALEAGKNGYVYVYFSNESETMMYFDNFQLTHEKGRVLEETHYYPFGLSMAGISSKAMGKMENAFKFNGGNELQNKEFLDGSGLELYDAKFRMLDPQLGRFWQADPLADFSVGLSPYNFGSNNPISRLDPWGLKDTTINGETMQRDPDLPTVTITPQKKAAYWGGFYWPSYSKKEVSDWRNERYTYNRRRDAGQAVIQGGESPLYLNNLYSFKRRFEAEEDGRKMSLGAVGIMSAPAIMMAAPVAGTAITKALATTYGRVFVRNAAINLLQNGGDHKKMDFFDITVNTFNPFNRLGGILGVAGVNSLVDYTPFTDGQRQLNYLGNGKNIGQASLDFNFGAFSGGAGTIFGSGSATATIVDIVTGNVSRQAQEIIKD